MKKQILFLPVVLASLICLLFLPFITSGQKGDPAMTDTITFQVDMKYMILDGVFNPLTDTAGIIISHDQWHETDYMERIGTSDIYEIKRELNLNVVYQYKFRMHKPDTIINEQTIANTRLVRIPDSSVTITKFFNNYNPAAIPMTFNCNMYYQIRAGHFIPNVDFLDVAGNFNGEGANDILFNDGYDSLYSLTVFMDTALISGPPLKFKFRFNGDWQTSELQGDSSRTYTLTGTNDSFTAWYNNIDPTVPTLPIVYDLLIQDTLYSKRTVTGSYRYEDYNLRPEGNSRYRWYIADSIGGALTMIDSAFSVSYTIDSIYLGKYLAFEVTPLTQDSVIGLPVMIYSQTPITGVGIYEKSLPLVRIFPNPVIENLFIEPLTELETISLYNISGQLILSLTDIPDRMIQINVRGMKSGLYFLQAISKNLRQGRYKFIVE